MESGALAACDWALYRRELAETMEEATAVVAELSVHRVLRALLWWSGFNESFAQIQDDKLYWRFESETLPEFSPDLLVGEITELSSTLSEGWTFTDGSFSSQPPLSAEEMLSRLLGVIECRS
jgi:hypothetical protein